MRPYHDPALRNYGGPHGAVNAAADIDGGKMDGFIQQAERANARCATATDHSCVGGSTDVMGWHDARDIPNYWAYAEQFVLQDHMFESNASWTLPAHLFEVSEWSAYCTRRADPLSCVNALDNPAQPPDAAHPRHDPIMPELTSLTSCTSSTSAGAITSSPGPNPTAQTLNRCRASRRGKTQRRLASSTRCLTSIPSGRTARKETSNRWPISTRRKAGRLPAVSWVVPSDTVSEHPPHNIRAGQAYVTSLINAVGESPDWDTSAIFLAWDDWGGFLGQNGQSIPVNDQG